MLVRMDVSPQIELHFNGDRIEVDKFEVGNMENNCYLATDPESRAALMVDAPWEPATILARCRDLDVKMIVLTHGHGDHVQALERVHDALGVPVGCHADDAAMMPVGPDFLINEGDTLDVGSLTLHALHTPGHTPGGLCLYFDPDDGTPVHLFTGDTLFPGGPGNTKQPLGDFDVIIDSIEDKLFAFDDSTYVYPGHGLDTTIGAERPHLDEWKKRRW